MVLQQAGYFGKPFRAMGGVRQGDIISPIIFNIMVDAVVWNWRHLSHLRGVEDLALFYADDGLLMGTDAETIQRLVDIMTRDFKSLGLKMNAKKTEYMTMPCGWKFVPVSQMASNRRYTGEGLTLQQCLMKNVLCLFCGGYNSKSKYVYFVLSVIQSLQKWNEFWWICNYSLSKLIVLIPKLASLLFQNLSPWLIGASFESYNGITLLCHLEI